MERGKHQKKKSYSKKVTGQYGPNPVLTYDIQDQVQEFANVIADLLLVELKTQKTKKG